MKNVECENGSCKVYVPFGQDWVNEFMKWKKSDVINELRKVLEEQNGKDDYNMRVAVNWYLERYGQTAQVLTAVEEMGELIAALNQYFFRDKISADSLSKEIADVEIMMQALRAIIGNDLVDVQKKKQIEKMLKFKEESEKS